MRSIFGKCIAIAMMAAIALVWQSPPVQADEHSGDVRDARTSARADARAAGAAVKAAEDAAEDAEDAAVAADEAADAAETAADAIDAAADASTADIDAARDAADAAREAADDARERAGYKQPDGDAEVGDPAMLGNSAVDAEDAWGQYKEALLQAGSQKYVEARYTDERNEDYIVEEDAATEGDIIPYKNAVGDAVANAAMDDAWSNYRETQWEYDQVDEDDHDADDAEGRCGGRGSQCEGRRRSRGQRSGACKICWDSCHVCPASCCCCYCSRYDCHCCCRSCGSGGL